MQTLEWMADCLALVILMVGVALRYRNGANLPGFLRFREPGETAPPAAPARRHRGGRRADRLGDRPGDRPARQARRRSPADRHA